MLLARCHKLAAVALVLGVLTPLAASAERPLDHEVKAALLFNFLRFVEWPDTPQPLEVCVVGETRVLEAAAALQGRSVGGRTVRVRRAIDVDLQWCSVAFIAASEDARLDEHLLRLGRGRALVVGDGPGFARRGAHLNLYVEEERVRFEANLRAIRRDGIDVSSRLLQLARIAEGS